jgi:hypothetical protein
MGSFGKSAARSTPALLTGGLRSVTTISEGILRKEAAMMTLVRELLGVLLLALLLARPLSGLMGG